MFWLIPLLKKFNHITKDASLFHLKLGDSCKVIYFPNSHPFRMHLPSSWPTYCKQSIFDMEKYNWPLQWSIFDMETFWHLVCSNLTSCKFSLFFFLIPLYIFQIYDVFINKILQGYIIIYFDYWNLIILCLLWDMRRLLNWQANSWTSLEIATMVHINHRQTL
jgi:hypothetical protein